MTDFQEISQVISFLQSNGNFNESMPKIQVCEIDSDLNVTFKFTVSEEHCNGYGTLHGGFIAGKFQ